MKAHNNSVHVQEEMLHRSGGSLFRTAALCKFSIGTATRQGTALVQVYLDGSVLLASGSTEMGQGLNTKLIQVTAHCIGQLCVTN